MALLDSSRKEQASVQYFSEQESYGGIDPGNEAPNARIQIEKALDVLMRQKWLVIGTFIVFVLAAIGFSFSQNPEYEAYTSILVDLGSSPKSNEDISVRVDDPFARNDWSLDAELFILQSSNTIAERVASRLVRMRDTASTALNLSILYSEEGQPYSEANISRRLKGYIGFSSTTPGINVLVVKATSGIPYEAALLSTMYSEEYVRLTQEANRTHVTSKREFLEVQEYERQEELRIAEESIKEFLQENGSAGIEQENNALLTHIAGLEVKRDEVNIELMTRKSKLASIEKTLSEIHPNLAANVASNKSQQIESLHEEIAKLELARTQILLRYVDQPERLEDEPEVEKIQRQIAQLEGQVKQISNAYIQEVVDSGGVPGGGFDGNMDHISDLHAQALQERIEIDGLEAQLNVIGSRMSQRKAELAVVPEHAMELSRLQRNRDYAEQMYQFVMSELQTTRLNEISEPGYAQIIREAMVPYSPVRPRPARNIFIGVMLGLLFGVGLAYGRHAMVTEILEPEQVQALGFPLLTVVPDMQFYIDQMHEGILSREIGGRTIDVRLVPLFDPGSVITETYRNIRAKVEFGSQLMEARTLLVTSPGPGDGKSITASNLAIIMAQAGRKTILVDADLRRPSVHELFGMSNSMGLSELYRKQPTFEWAATRTPVKNLYVMPAGRIKQNPVELVSLDRTHDIISMLKEWFEVIIFDTPPVLVATETKMLAAQCHGTIVVARASWTKDEELKHAVQELQSVDARIVGTVLNRFDVNNTIRHRNKYRYYSSYEQLPV